MKVEHLDIEIIFDLRLQSSYIPNSKTVSELIVLTDGPVSTVSTSGRRRGLTTT